MFNVSNSIDSIDGEVSELGMGCFRISEFQKLVSENGMSGVGEGGLEKGPRNGDGGQQCGPRFPV